MRRQISQELLEHRLLHMGLRQEGMEEKAMEMEKKILIAGPKAHSRMGLFTEAGWHEGYTLPTIEQRKAKRRAKNKVARKSRRVNRQKNK